MDSDIGALFLCVCRVAIGAGGRRGRSSGSGRGDSGGVFLVVVCSSETPCDEEASGFPCRHEGVTVVLWAENGRDGGGRWTYR